jgi:hypothetical protein
MNEGISLEEACANNVVGTEEDFERSCNKDGTVKSQTKTTTFTLKNDSTKSFTINDTHLQIGIVVILALVIAIVGLIIRKLMMRKVR